MDARWPAEITKDYMDWLKNAVNNKKIKLPVARAQVLEIIAASAVNNVN